MDSQVVPLAEDLRRFSKSILEHWQKVDESIEESKGVSLATLPVRYNNVTDYGVFRTSVIKIEQEGDSWVLQPYHGSVKLPASLQAPRSLLVVIRYLLEREGSTFAPTPSSQVPRNYQDIAVAIEQGTDDQNPHVIQFKASMERLDTLIAEAFGLSKRERSHIIGESGKGFSRSSDTCRLYSA